MQGLSISRIGKAALDLLYPPRCVICGTGGVFLCRRCMETLPAADGPRCDRCWLPVRGSACLACVTYPGKLTHLRSAFRYEASVRHVVHRFKFGGQSSLAPDLGRLMADTAQRHELEADVVVPVPLTAARMRTRGYNHARLMAAEVSGLTGVPVADVLRRSGHSRTQAQSPSAEDRRRNVDGVFSVRRDAGVAGLRVLLVDDVATTAATLNACAAVLLDAGAGEVSALTLARED